jgi:conjugal transfer pilus assembly protein TraK
VVLATLVLLGLAAPALADGISPNDLPQVPVSLDPRGRGSDTTGTRTATGGIQTVTVTPGQVQIVPVAVNHLNQIITPWHPPKVMTASQETVQVQGRSLYLAPRSEDPIAVFISPDGMDEPSLAVTFVPRAVPPAQVQLVVPAAIEAAFPVASPQALAWEGSHRFVDLTRELLRNLALGELPSGYRLREVTALDAVPACAGRGPFAIDFRSGQLIEGGRLEVLVGRVRRTGGPAGSLDFDERWCAEDGVVAVALFPSFRLAAGGEAELFVVRHRGERPRARVRPSLVPEGG